MKAPARLSSIPKLVITMVNDSNNCKVFLNIINTLKIHDVIPGISSSIIVDQKTFRRLLRILEIKLRVFGNWHIYLLVNMAAK